MPKQQVHMKYIHSNPNRAPYHPSLSTHESMWAEITSYTRLWYTTTLDIAWQIVDNKHWYYVLCALHCAL